MCMFLAPHGFKSVTSEQNLLPESQNKSHFLWVMSRVLVEYIKIEYESRSRV